MGDDLGKLRNYFGLIVGCLFFIEFGVMGALHFLSIESWVVQGLLDATLLTLVLLPALYFFHYRPLAEKFRRERQFIQELQLEKQRFQDVAGNVGDWVWEVDAEGAYTYCSGSVKKVLGYEADEVLGTRFYDHFHPDVREELKNGALMAFSQKQAFQGFRNLNIRKNGRAVMLETSGLPILDEAGKLLGYRGADRDVTREYEVEELLKRTQQHAKEIELTKAALLHAISHELRTPLNGITGALEVLSGTNLGSDQQEYVELAGSASKRLSALIDKILNYVQISRLGAVTASGAARFSDLLKLLKEKFDTQAQAKGLTLEISSGFEASSVVPVDFDLLSLVAQELLENAVKFTESGGVWLTLQKRELTLVLVVRDSGPGISPQREKMIFESFARGDITETRSQEGLGLGLAIVKAAAKSLHGQISYARIMGGGSEFMLTVPLKQTG